MSNESFQTLAFGQVEARLPEDCWARSRNARKGEFEHETVLYRAGDLRLSTLDLDFPATGADADPASVFMIVVDGSLQVDGPIANLETDGAVGLIVLGDLVAHDVVVGGQEMYVTGNLRVQGMFWGDYNHGQLTVKGNADVPLFVDTDEYHVDVDGRLDSIRRISSRDDEGEEQDLSGEELKAIFHAECLVDADGDPGLWREALVARLRQGQPVFRPEQLPQAPTPAVVDVFVDKRISPQSVALALAPAFFPAETSDSGLRRYDFWIGDTFCRGSWLPGTASTSGFKSLYFQGDDYAVTARLTPGATVGSEWHDGTLSFKMRRMDDKSEDPWVECGQTLPEPAQAFCEQAWQTLLEGLSSYVHARSLVPPDAVRRILALPLAAPYDDYYDDEKNGFWARNLYCSFRQEGALFNGKPRSAVLKIARDHTDADGDEKREFFVFDIQPQADGSETTLIRYTSDEDESSILQSYRGNAALLQRGAHMFRRAEERLHRYNRMLVENGEVAIVEEDFAMRYWREKGYVADEG